MYHVINNVLMGLNRVGGVFYDYAASVFIQSALLVILLFVIDLLLRKRVRAIFRYCVWLLVLVKLILPPMLSLPTGIGYWVGDHIPTAPGASNMVFDADALEFAGPSGKMPQVRPTENIAGDDSAMAPADSALTPLTWQAVLFLLWLAGVLAFLAVLIQRIRFVRGLVAASYPAGDELTGLLEQCRRQMTVRREIKLRLSEAIPSPAVCGLLRPTVLMPTSLVEKLSPEGLRATLIHELAHIKRGDLWVNSVQTFLQVVYFYNPFVWFANSAIRKVCEEAVDETVLVALGGQAKDYSNTLIDIGEMVFWKADLGLRLIGVAESKKALQWRIRHMLNRPIPKSSKLGALGITMILVIAAILLPMAKAQKLGEHREPVASENEQKPAKTLHQAAEDGDLAEVKRLIAEGADVNLKDEDGGTALRIAAVYDHTDIVELLIDKGANVNAPNRDGLNPLNDAVFKNNKEMVSLLISKGADVNFMHYRDNQTPLFWAVETRGVEIIKLLVDNGAKLDIKDISGYTVLRYAASWGLRDTVKLFLSKGVDTSSLHMAACAGDLSHVKELIQKGTEVDQKDEVGWTALFWAASAGQTEVSEFLIDKGADISANDGDDSNRRSLLHQAAQTNAVKLAELLIAKGADVNAKIFDGTPLHLACERGNKDVAELLIDKGADINAKAQWGSTPLLQAAWRGHKDVVELLIDKGADVNAKGFRGFAPLQGASSIGNLEVVKILISAGADVNVGNNMGQTPLYLAEQRGDTEIIELLKKHGAKKDTTLLGAAVSGDIEQVKLLISKSADVNAKNQRGNTPLYLAAQNGHKDVAELLIAKGADVNAKDNNGSTLLHGACFKNNKDIARLLIGKGAEVNVKDNANVTPLLTAATFGRITIAELLIDKGADVNAKNSREITSLHMAARNGFKDVVELLIAKGADVNVSNNAGVTPLDMAEERGNTEIVELLRKYGAKE